MSGETATAASPRVIVAIPTFRRPADLARLLAALPPVIERAQRRGLCGQVEVLVVDNDVDATARTIASAASLPVRYVQEGRRGLAAVRNRALDEARRADILVFIDDDETPAEESWLENLLTTRSQANAAVVAGPVRTVVQGALDPWIVAGGFYARAHRSGLRSLDPIGSAASNNLMLVMSEIERVGVRFDDRFGASGGEDSLFTSQLSSAGLVMVWCAEAPVLDHLLPERQTRAYALRRSRNMAAVGVSVAVALHGDTLARRVLIRTRALVVGAVRILSGLARRVGSRVTGSIRADARGARDVARGVGSWEGAVGTYRHVYGSEQEARTTALRTPSERKGAE